MDTPNSHAMTIDSGAFNGWDISITHIPHGIDAMDDLYALDLWTHDADHPTHTFETYRYGYGWEILNTALAGEDADLQAALEWWTSHHTTPAYAAHRILLAIDTTTWATTAEIADRLNLAPTDLDRDQQYGQALAAVEQHGLISWSNDRHTAGKPNTAPLVALSPAAYELIHPDDAATAATSQQRFTINLNTPKATTNNGPNPSRAGNAFPRLAVLQADAGAPTDVLPVPAPQQPLRPTR